MKLSDTQRKVLKRMAAGETLYFLNGLDAYAFWGGSYEHPRWPTIDNLEKLGLIKRFRYCGKFLLTDAGRGAAGEDDG